jgi:hypothetical protein
MVSDRKEKKRIEKEEAKALKQLGKMKIIAE